MSKGFIRLQNRTAPIHPQSEGIYYNNPPKKKYKDKYADNSSSSNENNNKNNNNNNKSKLNKNKDSDDKIEWVEEDIPSSAPPPFNPYKTQIKRAEKRITTIETKVRKDNSPCIEDLLHMRTVMLREKEIEMKRDQQRKKQYEIISKLEDALGKGSIVAEDTFPDEEEVVNYDDDNPLTAEFKERSIFIKERKYVAGRCSARLHQPMSKFQIYRLATRVYWSLTSTRDKPVSQILPWMFLGSKTTAANLQYLLDHGFTHILNVTQEVPNYHPDKFVYQRIPIVDSMDEDASARFKKAISFIQRVARSRGKVFIHCNAGNSRSPTMVMAYFIAIRKITLKDIYDYLQLVRISVFPNRHFLFQLSDLELAEGLGSSVRYAEEWKHYEYNSASAKSRPIFREPEGVYTTTCKIHSQDNSKLDFIDELEAELRRRETREKNHVSQLFSNKMSRAVNDTPDAT